MVKKLSLTPQAELEARLLYLHQQGFSDEKTVEEVFGPLEDWILQIGDRSLLLEPLNQAWLVRDDLHQTWEPTGVAVGEGNFFVKGDRLAVRWNKAGKARQVAQDQPAAIPQTMPSPPVSIPPSTVRQTTPPAKRRSAWAWIFSFSGMVVSCISLVCGGLSLVYGLTSQPASDEAANLLAQTQVAVSSTMTARAYNSSSSSTQNTPAGSIPAQTQAAGSSSAAQPATVTASYGNWQTVTCPGSATTRLAVGRQAYVGDVGGYSLTVFSKAGYDGEELYYLEEGAAMLVIGGPVCLDGQLWWQINIDQGNEGWVPEATASGQYLVEP